MFAAPHARFADSRTPIPGWREGRQASGRPGREGRAVFELHPRLREDCEVLGRMALSELLLMRDANYPWFILVPARDSVREIHELNAADRQQLLAESCLLAEALVRAFRPDKLNIAALGNVVPQLHLHHVVRYRGDASWPAPVWGQRPARPYGPGELELCVARLKTELVDGVAYRQ